eukprot:SM000050S16951  [mRNA]  locus=s50:44162:46830:+ [translate_table: standard]
MTSPAPPPHLPPRSQPEVGHWCSRCTAVAWVPGSGGLFVVAYLDGNLYVYDKSKDTSGDVAFPPPREPHAFSVAHARSSKSNPVARWHVCAGPLNALAFSSDGTFLACAGRDGFLRIFDFAQEVLMCGCKSYFGALLCCAWSGDGKYVLVGGEDDLVQVWSMEDQVVVAWAEGHSSWVSGVAFDPFWAAPPSSSSSASSSAVYRFGSVGQDAQLFLWDLALDEVAVPLRRLASHSSSSFPGGVVAATSNLAVSSPAALARATAVTSSPPPPPSKLAGFPIQGLQVPSISTAPPPPPAPQLPLPQPSFPHPPAAGVGHGAAVVAAGSVRTLPAMGGAMPAAGAFGGTPRAGAGPLAAILKPAPARKDVPKLSAVMAHKLHVEPLSDIAFVKAYVVTACHEGQLKIWSRPPPPLPPPPPPPLLAAKEAAANNAPHEGWKPRPGPQQPPPLHLAVPQA